MLLALLLTVLAGGATSVGAAIALIGSGTSDRFLAAGLGFSAGVMLYVSFAELLPQGAAVLSGAGPGETATRAGTAWAAASFFAGMILVAALSRLVPQRMPRAVGGASAEAPGLPAAERARRARLLRTGALTAAVLALHNLPEGFATFVAALQSPRVAVPVVIAIALHNIPEGIAVAIPVRRATGSRRRAFWLATTSGMAEPVGAVIGWLLLSRWLDGPALGAVLAAVAGVMVLISLDELLPSAEESGEHGVVVGALITGMAVMAGSLLLLG